MVKFAIRSPAVFSNIEVQAVEAPAQEYISVSNTKHLLRKTLEELSSIFEAKNPAKASIQKTKVAMDEQGHVVDAGI